MSALASVYNTSTIDPALPDYTAFKISDFDYLGLLTILKARSASQLFSIYLSVVAKVLRLHPATFIFIILWLSIAVFTFTEHAPLYPEAELLKHKLLSHLPHATLRSNLTRSEQKKPHA